MKKEFTDMLALALPLHHAAFCLGRGWQSQNQNTQGIPF
jgi:hypothetical protein